MAQTQTGLTEAQARAALAKLTTAAAKFREAIRVFQSQYDCDTTGLDEWASDIGDTLFEIRADIDFTYSGE